jgi:hypothetical protein
MRGVKLGRILLVAGLINILGLAANSATSFATDQANGALRWVFPPAIALTAALLTAVVQAAGAAPTEPEPQPGRSNGPVPPPYAPSPRRPTYWQPSAYPQPSSYPQAATVGSRRRSVPVAILVMLLVCGVGAATITVGVRYVVGYVTGNESGDDRLIQPATARAGNLTLLVDKIEYTSHFTRVGLVARNAGTSQVSLPLFGDCVFTGGDGTTLQADDFRSRWSTTVPPGGVQRGTVTFGGQLPDGVPRASLSFSTVFSAGGGSITVRNIRLRSG